MMAACICGTAGRTVTSDCSAASVCAAEKRGSSRICAPVASPAASIEVSPNTCVSGRTPQMTSSACIPRSRAELSPPKIRFPWVSITPLGVPVVPVV